MNKSTAHINHSIHEALGIISLLVTSLLSQLSFADQPTLTRDQSASLSRAANDLKAAILDKNVDQILKFVDTDGFEAPEGDDVISYLTIAHDLKSQKGHYYCNLFGGCVRKHKHISVIEKFAKYKEKNIVPEFSVLDRSSPDDLIEVIVTYSWKGRDRQKNYDAPEATWVYRPGKGWLLGSLFE